MEEWKQRLRDAREKAGLNKTKFAHAVGVSNATITDWEKSSGDGGIKEISGVNLTRACEVLGVTATWLLNGDDAPQKLPPGFIRVEAVEDDDPRIVLIPKVRLRLSAGISGFEVEPELYDGSTTTIPTDWMERKGYSRDKLLAIRVRGESMEPTLYEDDLVVINTADKKPIDGGVYAINYEGEPVVKRMQRDAGEWWLQSDNLDQRKYHRKICRGDACLIIGKVVRKESERF